MFWETFAIPRGQANFYGVIYTKTVPIFKLFFKRA
jgi:hypothetical protein